MTDQTQTTALDHLGLVLYATAGVPEDERCVAMDEALAFYNAARPDRKVELVKDAGRYPDIADLQRDARRWRQIDYVMGSVITIRDTRISNNVLPASQLGRLLDEDANRD